MGDNSSKEAPNKNEVEPEIVQPRPREDNPSRGPVATFYSGPIPDPEDFAAYEKAVPGAGKTILNAFSAQTKHRHKMEKKAINTEVSLQILAMILGWSITVIIALGALFLIYKGKSIAGLITLAGVILGRWFVSTRQDPKTPKKK